MKRKLLLLSVLLVGFGASAKEMRLFLLIGQSNMAGRGVVREQDKVTHPRIFMMDRENRWVPARDPVHFDKPVAGVGLCSSFARKDAQEHPDATIGLIPCAAGGTGLDEWMPGKKLYTNAVFRTNLAKKDGRLVGILWHQGETDSNHYLTTISYTTRFREFITQLRSDLGAQDVPVVVGEFGSFFPPSVTMNRIMHRASVQTPLCGCASAADLTHKGDLLHFDSKSLSVLGERYHEVFSSLEQETCLKNSGMEETKGGIVSSWEEYGKPYQLDTQVRHRGNNSIRCDLLSAGTSGFTQRLIYKKPDKRPVVFGGWSRAKNAMAGEYCIYMDVWYEGGGNEWGLQANWSIGTHDWERCCEILYPEKPIKKIEMFVFLRGGSGTAWFDDLFLERRELGLEVVSSRLTTDRPHTQRDQVTLTFPKNLTCWVHGGPCQGTKYEQTLSILPNQRRLSLFLSDGVDGADVVVPLGNLKDFSLNQVPDRAVRIWTADSMRKITPLTFPTPEDLKNPELSLELARRERECAQIQITTGNKKELRDVTLELPVLRDEKGEPFQGNLKWERVGYIARRPGYYGHPCAPDDSEKWLPDPLLPAAPFRVRECSTQGAWITAYAAPDAKPGIYRGTVSISVSGRPLGKVPLSLRVRNFSQPETFGMPTAFSIMDGFIRAYYPDRYERMRKLGHGIMLDHRLNPDDISRTTPPRIEDLLKARERGMNRFNIMNLVVPPKDPNSRWVCTSSTNELFAPAFYDYVQKTLTPYVAELRKHDLQKYAYVYGFDERCSEYYQGIDAIWRKLKRDFPDIPLMTTAMMYKDMANGETNSPYLNTTDWFCPDTSVFQADLSKKLHAQGKQVWWYVCCGPVYPYANFASIEYPLIEGRLLGWMTHLYRSNGLLFWHVNYWEDNPLQDEGDTYLTEWNSYSALHMPGDGILLYPGKHGILPSIRLAQVRDGVEDYEWLQLAAEKKGLAAADACSRRLIRSMTDYSRSPEKLRRARTALADLIE